MNGNTFICSDCKEEFDTCERIKDENKDLCPDCFTRECRVWPMGDEMRGGKGQEA